MQNVMPYLLLHFFLTKTKKKTLRFYLVICNSYRCCKLPVKSINFDRALKILIDSAFVMKLLIQIFFFNRLKGQCDYQNDYYGSHHQANELSQLLLCSVKSTKKSIIGGSCLPSFKARDKGGSN